MHADDGALLVASGVDGGVCERAVHPMLVPPASPQLIPTFSSPYFQLSNSYNSTTFQRLELGTSLGNALTLDFGGGSGRGVAIAVACMIDALPPAGGEAMLFALHSSLVLSDRMAVRLAVQSDGAVRFQLLVSAGGPWVSYQVTTGTAVSAGVWVVVVASYMGANRQMSVWLDGADATIAAEASAAAAQVCLNCVCGGMMPSTGSSAASRILYSRSSPGMGAVSVQGWPSLIRIVRARLTFTCWCNDNDWIGV